MYVNVFSDVAVMRLQKTIEPDKKMNTLLSCVAEVLWQNADVTFFAHILVCYCSLVCRLIRLCTHTRIYQQTINRYSLLDTWAAFYLTDWLSLSFFLLHTRNINRIVFDVNTVPCEADFCWGFLHTLKSTFARLDVSNANRWEKRASKNHFYHDVFSYRHYYHMDEKKNICDFFGI